MSLDVAILVEAPGVALQCTETLARYGVPADLRPGLVRYLVDGIRPGGFLCAVLENDLAMACLRAAPEANVMTLPGLVKFLYNEAPFETYGNAEKVNKWIARKRGAVAIVD